jgi:ferric-dicitrate binding protein FerR (iron transport regulator)
MERKLVGALCMTGLLLWAGAVTATPAGIVVVTSGSWTDRGRMLNRGDAVRVGDIIDVPVGGYLKLQMADGSVISLAPESSLTVLGYNIDDSGRNVSLSLARGALRAQVTPGPGRSTFDVSTAGGLASVVSASADWFIKAQLDSVQVGVLAGVIDLKSAVTGESVSIPARWGTRLETGLDPVLPRIWAQSEFSAVIRLTGT